MKNKQFGFRCDDNDLMRLANLSQKLHLPYSKCIRLAILLLNDYVISCFDGKRFTYFDGSKQLIIMDHLNRRKELF